MAGIRKRLESFFNKKKRVEESPFFVKNGGVLMEKLLSLSNGRDEIHIKRFTIQEITDATNNFEELAMYRLYGKMYKGNLDGRPILVVIWEELREWINNDFILFSTAISALMSHLKNVLKLIGCCLDFELTAIVYEYAGTTMLSDFLGENPDFSLSWGNRIKIARDIAGMLVYLHTCFPMAIVHRDLHPDNVFIDKKGRVGCGIIDREYGRTGLVTTKIDVYTFGVILLMLLTGKYDFLDSEGHIIGFIKFVEQFISSEAQMDTFVDPRIIQDVKVPEFEAILDIAIRCLRIRGEDPPEMIDVARILHQIDKDTTT